MLYNNEDEFLKILASKISKLNTKQPSSNDWADFELAYRKHKNKKQNKKWLLVLWFGLFSILCLGIFYVSNYNLNLEETTTKYKGENNKIDYKKITSKESKAKTITSNRKSNAARIFNKDNKITDSKISSKKTSTLKTNFNKIEITSKIPQTTESQNFNSDFQIKKYNSGIVYLLNSRRYLYNLVLLPLNLTIPFNKLKYKLSDSVKMNPLSAPTKSSPIATYFELGLSIQNNNFTQLDYPSDQFFKGVGLNAGMRLQNNWSFNLGLNVMYLNQVKINKFSFQTEEHQIDRIDTTIKYNTNYNRLMMQFDTVMSYKNVNHESSSVFKNNILFISIPLQARYHIGNDKHSIYGSFGVTGTLIYQLQSLEKNVGLANENSQTTNDYTFLFAPTIGLGFHQRIYKDWTFHLASNYSNYLNSNLNQSNTFQFQTGIKYNF